MVYNSVVYMKKNIYIAVSGVIGSGKTTAAALVAQELEINLIPENFGENIFLPRFYRDMKRWAFHSQTFFLTVKFKQLKHISEKLHTTSVVVDTPIEQDVFSYGRAQFELGTMDTAEWDLYRAVYTNFSHFLKPPDFIIYLDAATENLLLRIEKRGRDYEQKISADYLELLGVLNQRWLIETKIPVIRIDTNELNIVSKKEDQEEFVKKVKQAIEGS